MKIAVIGHALVLERNRARWVALAERHPDVQVHLLVPETWKESRYGDTVAYQVRSEQRSNYFVQPVPTMMIGRHCLFRSLDLHLRQIQPDILQLATYHTSWLLMQVLWYAWLWTPWAKVVWFTYENIYRPPKRAHQRWKQALLFRAVDAAIAGGECVRQVLERLGFPKSIHVQTEIGVDPSDYDIRRDSDLCLQLNLTGCVIGFVGALREEKGVRDLFCALRYLTGDWSLIVVGGGGLQPELENLAHTDIRLANNPIRFTGRVAHESVSTYYQCMDILVLPSHTTETWREQFGLVLAEAMLSKVAVVGSDSGEIPYVVDSAGLVFPEKDVFALRACLQRLIDNPEIRRDLALQGYERATRMYSASALADGVYSIYQQLLCADSETGANDLGV